MIIKHNETFPKHGGHPITVKVKPAQVFIGQYLSWLGCVEVTMEHNETFSKHGRPCAIVKVKLTQVFINVAAGWAAG